MVLLPHPLSQLSSWTVASPPPTRRAFGRQVTIRGRRRVRHTNTIRPSPTPMSSSGPPAGDGRDDASGPGPAGAAAAADGSVPVSRSIVERWKMEPAAARARLLLRAVAWLFSLLALVVMASNKHGHGGAQDFDNYPEYTSSPPAISTVSPPSSQPNLRSIVSRAATASASRSSPCCTPRRRSRATFTGSAGDGTSSRGGRRRPSLTSPEIR